MSKKITIDHDWQPADYMAETAHLDSLSPVTGRTSSDTGEHTGIEARPAARQTLVLPNHPQRPPAEMMRQADQLVAMPSNGATDGTALAAMETVSERSTPIARAWSVGIVALIFVLMAVIVCFALWLAGAPGSAMLVLFAVCVVLATLLVYFDSNRFSPTGVERFKAGQYTKIRQHEIDSQERIALRKLELYQKVLEKVYDRNE